MCFDFSFLEFGSSLWKILSYWTNGFGYYGMNYYYYYYNIMTSIMFIITNESSLLQ